MRKCAIDDGEERENGGKVFLDDVGRCASPKAERSEALTFVLSGVVVIWTGKSRSGFRDNGGVGVGGEGFCVHKLTRWCQ